MLFVFLITAALAVIAGFLRLVVEGALVLIRALVELARGRSTR